MFKQLFAHLYSWMSATWNKSLDETETGVYFDYEAYFGEYIYLDEYGM